MHRWMAGAAVVGAVFSAAPVQADMDSRTFERLGTEHWAYRAVQRLETAGYFTGCPDGTFNGTRRLTRYEFARALERIYRSLYPRVLSADSPGNFSEDLFGFNVLLGEFAPDISALGYDLEEMRRQVRLLQQRMARMRDTAPETPAPSAPLSPTPATPRRFGFSGALPRNPLSQTAPGYMRSPYGPTLTPGITAGGPGLGFGFEAQGPDPLDTAGNLPFEDPAAGVSYRAQLSFPLGRYLLQAFYNRDNGRTDRYGLWNPFLANTPFQGVGTALSGNVSERLGFGLETNRLKLEDDPSRLLTFKGRLDYKLGGGFGLGLGYERLFQYGQPGGDWDSTSYTLNVSRSLGRNTQFNFLYRYIGVNAGGGAGRNFGDTGAVGQITVRF